MSNIPKDDDVITVEKCFKFEGDERLLETLLSPESSKPEERKIARENFFYQSEEKVYQHVVTDVNIIVDNLLRLPYEKQIETLKSTILSSFINKKP